MAHTFTHLLTHIIFSTKDRQPFLDGDLKTRLFPYLAGIIRAHDGKALIINAPTDHVRLLRRLQRARCAQSGGRLWKTAEIDHRVPLFRVWQERRDAPWQELLGYWGLPNLQVINRDAHVAKCAEEARYRSEDTGKELRRLARRARVVPVIPPAS